MHPGPRTRLGGKHDGATGLRPIPLPTDPAKLRAVLTESTLRAR